MGTLKVNETKITTENALKQDDFGMEDSHESNIDAPKVLWKCHLQSVCQPHCPKNHSGKQALHYIGY